jgi:alanyl-tRNA synthetase
MVALAEAAIAESLQELDAVKNLLKNPKDTVKAIENLQSELSGIKKQLEAIEQQQWAIIAQDLANKAILVNNKKFIGAELHVSNADALKKICSDLRAHASLIVVVASIDGKAQVAVGVDDTQAQEFNAATIIKQHIAPLIKGGGGGQSTLATAGGQDVSKLQDIITVVKGLL